MKTITSNHKSKSQFDLPSFIDVDEVYVTYRHNNKTYSNIPAMKLAEDRYLDALNKQNDITEPSFADKQIYYSLIDDKLTLLPQATTTDYYTNIQVLYIEDFESFNQNTDIPITREFKDLLITLAATEAMIDIARGDKVQLMKVETNDNFRLLGAYATDRKNREGTQE